MLTLLERLLHRLFGPARAAVMMEFARFGTVGGIGFVVDNATVYGLRTAVGLYWAGALAYLTAATTTWLLNRLWTYRGRGTGAAHRQWALFLLTQLAGFVLNRGAYALLITFVPLTVVYPVLAIACGTAAGMFVNFHFARNVVFK